MNVKKVFAKEHQVVHSLAADEIYVLKTLFCKHSEYIPVILPYYRRLKSENGCMIFLSTQRKGSVTYIVVSEKTMLHPLNITLLHKVLYKVILKTIKSLFLRKKSEITDIQKRRILRK